MLKNVGILIWRLAISCNVYFAKNQKLTYDNCSNQQRKHAYSHHIDSTRKLQQRRTDGHQCFAESQAVAFY